MHAFLDGYCSIFFFFWVLQLRMRIFMHAYRQYAMHAYTYTQSLTVCMNAYTYTHTYTHDTDSCVPQIKAAKIQQTSRCHKIFSINKTHKFKHNTEGKGTFNLFKKRREILLGRDCVAAANCAVHVCMYTCMYAYI